MNRESILSTKLLDDQIALFYLGQEGILIKYRERYLLIDAYLSDYVDRNCCTSDVRWVRKYDAPISGEELDFVDYVFCTHAHYDHADPITLSDIARVNKKAKFIVPAPIVDTVKGYGVDEESMIPAFADEKIVFGDIVILPIPAAHEELSVDGKGRYDALGYRITLGNTVLFHAGDCCIYDGLEERLGGVDVMCLPVNGRSYYKRVVKDIIGNMDAYEATELSGHVGAKLLIPMHIDLYDVNGLSLAAFVDAVENVDKNMRFHIFRPGERYIYADDGEK